MSSARATACSASQEPPFVAGVGINATDTILRLPRFPARDSKVPLLSADRKPGGQVASAMIACQRWGLRARYVGKVGDDPAGSFQMQEMEREGLQAHWIIAPGCNSQIAYILVDEPSGERTVLWKRDPAMALLPEEMRRAWISGAAALLVDGHDTAASAQVARGAREERIPVIADLDNRYPGVEALLECVDYPICSRDFPIRVTGERDLLKALPALHARFGCHLVDATLGRLGVLAWDGSAFHLCPGFRVRPLDTTGAGDIFHGAFVYGLASGWPIKEILEFSCAAAALNCTAIGARGHIATLAEIAELRHRNDRSEAAYTVAELELAEDSARSRTVVAREVPASEPRKGNNR